jgi:hypothetical protein
MTNTYNLVGKHETEGLLKGPLYRGEDKMDLKETGGKDVGSGQGPLAIYCEYGHGFQVSLVAARRWTISSTLRF